MVRSEWFVRQSFPPKQPRVYTHAQGVQVMTRACAHTSNSQIIISEQQGTLTNPAMMDDASSSCSSSSGYQSSAGGAADGRPQKTPCQHPSHNGDLAEDFVVVDRVEGQSPQRFPQRRWSSSIPRVRYSTSRPDEAVDIAMGESGLAAAEPLTVGEMMQRTVVRVPHHVALRYKISGGSWRDVTYRDYYRQCLSAAKSFLKVSTQCG